MSKEQTLNKLNAAHDLVERAYVILLRAGYSELKQKADALCELITRESMTLEMEE